MFFKAMTLMLWMVAVCMGASLFWASGEVQDAENKHLSLTKEIARIQARLHVLNAEWHYLNNPEYLEQMAARYLNIENHIDGNGIVVAGDSLPRYAEISIPPEKPDVVMVQSSKTGQEKSMIIKAAPSETPAVIMPHKEDEFRAVLANWSGGQ